MKYILDGHTPVRCDDLMQWARWFETGDRRVAEDRIGESHVSTVFLGIDHDLNPHRPALFETLVLSGPLAGESQRYATWEAAVEGHAAMVRLVTAGTTTQEGDHAEF